MSAPYRVLFVGELVQESFLSVGGTDDPYSSVDSPFCRDGQNRPTLRGSGLAGALIATLRRLEGNVPESISGAKDGRARSVWRAFNSHPAPGWKETFRQHVAIDDRTGASASGMLFSVGTLPPGTRWPFLLEVDTARCPQAADLAREALSHWAAGRCYIGREIARGLGWMRLENARQYTLTTDDIHKWPRADHADGYPSYIAENFFANSTRVEPAQDGLPNVIEITGRLIAGNTDWGLDSLSIGGHASEEIVAAWDNGRFLSADGITGEAAKSSFDPDFAVATWENGGTRLPFIPGSALRGPLRKALTRLLWARKQDTQLASTLFGTVEKSAKLLICDALPEEGKQIRLAWLQHHAEDEFTAGVYADAKFDRVAVVEGTFKWKMVLEADNQEELDTLRKECLIPLKELAEDSQIGIGGGKWRGHGWLRWEFDKHWAFDKEGSQ